MRKRKSAGWRTARIFYSLTALCVAGVALGTLIIATWASNLKIPDLQSFNERKVIESTKIYDRTGKILLWDIHQNIQRTVAPFDQISRHIKNATVAIEDSSFYQHKGVDLRAIMRALFVDFITGSAKQGGSTITQQLVKNTFFTREKSIERKIKELILAVKIEKMLPKEEILNLYLNEIPYGGSSYGIEAASQNFFNKPARQLTLVESAYLASLAKAPTYYSPYGEHRNELEERKNLVLSRMAELGFVAQEEAEKAKKEKVKFVSKADNSLKAPHFSIFIRSYLEKKYGKDAIEEDGLRVATSLDYNLQQIAEELVLKFAKENKEKFNASNAGLVAIDPKTGQILAMVGSKNYFNVEEEGNFNITLAHRQPGSSIKPFVYATAFKKGYTPNTVVFDLLTEFNASCNPDGTPQPGVKPEDCYMPENYDNLTRGPVSLRNALAQSINIPSVKVLYLAGLRDSLQTTRDMGITSLTDPDRYGLTLVLGGGEVTPLELTGAYAVFANNGARNPVTGILKIEDRNGKTLEKFASSPQQVIDKNISLLISDILTDNEARAPAFGQMSWLYFSDRPVAVKTGTTNNYRDAWVMGYTPNLAVGVWAGNNDNTPMEKKVAGFIAAPLWNAFLTEVFKKLPVENFEKPIPLPEPKPILAGDWLAQATSTSTTQPEAGQPLADTPQIHEILYWLNKDNPLGPQPQNPEHDSQFSLWEWPVAKWAKENGY
ncbi:MAG: PBP1A family penicillin-binding protein [Candidatus Terrybacteria bacterium]|nr:PBP1A family penicillin-binding protein [Candidatus Terrybacteria bacterium]